MKSKNQKVKFYGSKIYSKGATLFSYFALVGGLVFINSCQDDPIEPNPSDNGGTDTTWIGDSSGSGNEGDNNGGGVDSTGTGGGTDSTYTGGGGNSGGQNTSGDTTIIWNDSINHWN